MQIREQGQQVQLIRSPYDSTKKRCVQKVFITFKKRYRYATANLNDYLSAEQVAELSADENKTLSDWLTTKVGTGIISEHRYLIDFASSTLIRTAEAVLSEPVSQGEAGYIWIAMDKLAQALKKAGHPKPKSDKKLAVDSRQGVLLDRA